MSQPIQPNLSQTLSVLSGTYAVCRLDKSAPIPDWAQGAFVSITRNADELSIVCPDDAIPDHNRHITADRGWCCLKIKGPFDLNATGIMVSVAAPLAHIGVSIFVIATYDTDYLLVRRESLDRAIKALEIAGHKVEREN